MGAGGRGSKREDDTSGTVLHVIVAVGVSVRQRTAFKISSSIPFALTELAQGEHN